MSTTTGSNGQIDPGPIYELIRRVRFLLRISWVGTGLALSIGLGLAILLVGALLDMAAPLWPSLRVAALVLIVVPTLWAMVVGVFIPLLRRLRPTQVARRIEQHLPGIHNRLVTSIDLADQAERTRTSEAFYRRLLREALARISGFEPGTVIDRRSMLRAVIFAASTAIAFVVILVLLFGRMPTAMARLFVPLGDIPPASDVQYDVLPGSTQVLRGEPFVITATITAGKPRHMSVELLRDEAGARRLWHDMRLTNEGVWEIELHGLADSFAYRVHGGGTWSRQYRVALLERPTIRHVETVLHYPAYMGNVAPRRGAASHSASPLDVTGPVGSSIEVVADVGGDVSEGEIQLLTPQTVDDKPTGELEVARRFAMQRCDDGRWTGRFPLESNGHWRVELRNALGHANKTMTEARYVAIADLPPQVVLERPGRDLVLSKPGKVLLALAVYDDFALSDVALAVQEPGAEQFIDQPVKTYPDPRRSDTLMTTLDLTAMAIEAGAVVKYQLKVRDRKEQAGQTDVFNVRIEQQDGAADLRLARFERSRDDFRQKLLDLIAQQAKLHASVQDLVVQYLPLARLVGTLGEADPAQAPELTDNVDAPEVEAQLNDAQAQQLEALSKQLKELAAQQQQNIQLGEQIDKELAQAVTDTEELEMMPPQAQQHMMMLQQQFQQTTLNPMRRLSEQLSQGAEQRMTEPQTEQMQQLDERVQQQMEALQKRMEQMDLLRRKLWEDMQQAVAGLEQQMLGMQAETASSAMWDLQQHMSQTQQQLQQFHQRQQQLMQSSDQTMDEQMAELLAQQETLEQEAEPVLIDAEELFDVDAMLEQLAQQRQPQFPQAPYAPDEDNVYYVAPSEDDPDEPLTEQERASGPQRRDRNRDEEEYDRPLYMPDVGGPRAIMDPRYADRTRPAQHRQDPYAMPETPREQLQSRQQHLLDELKQARNRQDGGSAPGLGQMQQRLQQSMRSMQSSPSMQSTNQGGSPQSMQQLSRLLSSPAMQRAMQMAAQLQPQQAQPLPAMPMPMMSTGRSYYSAWGGYGGSMYWSRAMVGEDEPIDLPARTVILKMQPRVREQLLQAMRDEGPEGYQTFIRQYFRRLAEAGAEPEKE